MSALVSVILTSYNHQKYIGEAIESVLNQTFTDFELIIVDDCSVDDSWDVIQNYSDPRIVAIRNDVNLYMKSFRDVVLHVAKGKYLAIHHSDDVWEATKLERQVAFLETNEKYAACFTHVEFIDEHSERYELPEGNFYKGVFDKENRVKEEWLNYFFYNGNCLCHPSIFIRKEMYEKYNLLDTFGLAQVPDLIMWIKLCRYEEIFIVPEKLTKFRLRREKQENASADRPEVHIRSQMELYYLLQEFTKIHTQEDFLRVFPESKKYCVYGEMNLNFALAKLLQDTVYASYWLLANMILFSLINDSSKASEIERLYNYTDKDFMRDNAKYDIFGTQKRLKYMHSTLYVDFGTGYNENDKIMKEIYVRQDGSFFVEYEVNDRREIKQLRFDPTENELITISINQVMINEYEYKIKSKSLLFKNVNGYQAFYSYDPQYFIDYMGEGAVKVGILGKLNLQYDLYPEVLEEKYRITSERDYVIAEKEQVIAEKERVKAEKKYLIMERDQALAEINNLTSLLNSIYNSRGYKLLNVWYNIKKRFKG